MRLMYIASVDFYTKPNPSFHLMESMIEDLFSSGIGVYFIGVSEEGVDKHIPEHIEKDSNFSYDLVSIPKVKKSSFIKRYLLGVSYSFKIGKYIKKNIDFCDVIFVQSSPTVLYTICKAKKHAKGRKIVYNVQDMFPGSSIASGVMPQKWMQNVFYFLQRIAYRKADVIVAISEDMKKKLLEQKVSDEKIEVIVNWFDDKTVQFVEWEQNRFVQKYNMSKDMFYIQYAGTMGYVFDYKIVLDVAERLKDYKDIIFQMIGEGSQKKAFIEGAHKKRLINISFLPLEPQHMVSDVYSACSVCYIPLKSGVIGNSVPSKVGLLMACKKAIVLSCDEGSDYSKMINESGAGIAVGINADKVVNALIEMKNSEQKCVQCGQDGYAYGRDLFSRNYGMKRYISLFEKSTNSICTMCEDQYDE